MEHILTTKRYINMDEMRSEQEIILDNHDFQLKALSKPFRPEVLTRAKLQAATRATPFNSDEELSTGEPKTAAGYYQQMLTVFGPKTPPVTKAMYLMETYGEDYVPPGDENAVSYYLGKAWFEVEFGGQLPAGSPEVSQPIELPPEPKVEQH